jgi:tRNA(His) 5'-end guanylyltransferase
MTMPQQAVLREYEQRVEPGTWTVIRLDGRGFTGRTQAYERPFDRRFHDAMRAVSEALLADVPAAFVHTASDEISLFIPPESAGWFDGRLSKWLSVSAGIAAAAMGHSMTLFDGEPIMDARALVAPDQPAVAAYLSERARSARRNCRQSHVHYGLIARGMSSRQADGVAATLTPIEVAELVGEPDDWEAHGAVAFHNEVEHQGMDPRTSTVRPTVRRRLVWAELRRVEDIPDGLFESRPSSSVKAS